MKALKSIFGMLVLVALWGCTKTEIATPEKEVTFAVGEYAATATKSNVSLDTYGITSFKSKAYLHADGYENETQNFFGVNGETISKQGNVWAPSHPYYWPKSELSYVNFVSWYDKNGAPTNVSEYALAWTNRTIVADDDIMYADEAWRYNSGDVVTLFHHALAQVKFQARTTQASDGNVSWTVTIRNFRIENVRNTGSLSLINSDPNTSWTTKPWTNTIWTQAQDTETLSSNGEFTLSSTNQVIMDTRTVLPQTTFGMVLSFDYSINTTYNIEGNPISSVSENAHATINLYSDFRIYNWNMNTCTTYTIVFNPETNKISFDPALTENWNTDPNNSMYIE